MTAPTQAQILDAIRAKLESDPYDKDGWAWNEAVNACLEAVQAVYADEELRLSLSAANGKA